ncbi:MAG: DivIVA domain-containing protein [Oscillospiraceae bacterium]|nr:DivIVA domain-containing protein [Oscillospiraceae bacterium]
MNAKDIATKKFEKATFGYKPEEVDEYLKDVAIALSNATKEKEESEAKIIKLVERINEYRNDEDAIRDAILVSQKQGNKIIADARAEADKIIADAQAQRDALLADISNDCEALKRSEVEKIAVAIKEENDKMNAVVAASKTQTEMQTDKLNKMKVEISDFKKKVLLVLNEQIRVVSNLPELSDEEISKIVSGQVKPAAQAPAQSAEKPTEATSAAPEATTKVTANATVNATANTAEKPTQQTKSVTDKRRAFGFDESMYKKQEFSSEELKFGHNSPNKK